MQKATIEAAIAAAIAQWDDVAIIIVFVVQIDDAGSSGAITSIPPN